MNKWRRPIRLLFVVIGLAVGASIAPSLSSCSAVTSSVEFLVNPEAGESLAEGSRQQLDRFEDVYNKYVSK